MTEPTEKTPKKAGLMASTALVATMTMLSRVLGLVRDVVIARMLGASAGADAFFVALKIPNFLRRLFAEGAFAGNVAGRHEGHDGQRRGRGRFSERIDHPGPIRFLLLSQEGERFDDRRVDPFLFRRGGGGVRSDRELAEHGA